jgi:hypothetical protein
LQVQNNVIKAEKRLAKARKKANRKIAGTTKAVKRLVERSRAMIDERRRTVLANAGALSVKRDVRGRVDVGLGELESIILELRNEIAGRARATGEVLDDAAYRSVREEAKKIIQSEFFKSMMEQLERREQS